MILSVALAAGCLNLNTRTRIRPELAAAAVAGSARAAHSPPMGERGPDELRTFPPPLPRLPSADQIEDYRANRPKSVVELQQFRELTRMTVDGIGAARPWPA